MKVSFLIHTIYGIGGTIRTTLNLAEELADRHEVEIVSVFRHRDKPLFAIDPRISVVPLVDTRPKSATNEKKHPDHLRAAESFPRHEARYQEYSALTDERVRDHYAGSDADVVIGTRPGLTAYAARFAPEGAVLIGQEHMTHNHHKEELRAEMREHLARLDAFVTVSEGDAAVWRERFPLPDTRILAVPNSVPEPPVAPSDGSARLVVAAGRLSGEKRYDVLLDAWAKVAAERPDWELRIYGWGTQGDKLRKKADRLGLYNSVHFMGPHSPIEPEWAKGSVAVSTSRHESFGMTLVEAMRCGLPVVSTDCDYGPREILKDGEDGLLVPVGDADAVAGALLRLIGDEELRREMAAAAVRNGRRFDPETVAARYEELFRELVVARGLPALSATGAKPAPDAGPAGRERPVADCEVAADGALTFRLVTPAEPGDELLCVQGEEVRAWPFGPDGAVTVGAAETFAEGLWECFVRPAAPDTTGADAPATGERLPATGERLRLRARVIDGRGALRARERVAPGRAVRHPLPYATHTEKLLGLRAWDRPVHAECRTATVAGPRLTLTGELLGAAPATASGDRAAGDRPVLLARRRGDGDEAAHPGEWTGDGGFRCVLPLTGLVGRRGSDSEVWDLLLRYAPDAEPVAIGKLLDDVVAKAKTHTYPERLLPLGRSWGLAGRVVRRALGRDRARAKVRTYYVATNDLVIHVATEPRRE
ncbi:glycosyltransferase [Streptomyces sp. LP05-1]|uniref:D-inositol 3-phosphate glycosyltransferase n=1 Tax=Streptomyces pyxinae TaxID=2970734 RepID=A0ABT2CNG4_9ACTN|nr:glycosyltransferase [Streptomyces sp. LP05-1]MCS0638119.1 glycosyltransferase [Streptomyces sp. LP05-1]